MNQLKLIFIISFLTITSSAIAREVRTLQTGWKFAKGNIENAFQIKFDDSKWKDITIPHDWAIGGPVLTEGDGNTGKLPWKGEGWYRKKLSIGNEFKGKTVYLIFDGVMASPVVYVNGKEAGRWDYGYNSFYLDITGLVNYGGQNVVAVHADTRSHDSRWYPGAGIYRKVQMIITDPVHLSIWGNYITTPVINQKSAEVKVVTTVINRSESGDDQVRVVYIAADKKGKETARREISENISAGSSKDIEASFMVSNPELWDVNNPALYSLKTEIYHSGRLTDSNSENFGIRTVKLTADNGLILNGRRVQIKGVCLHHDQGPLGASFYPRAMERQLEIMKSMGCNALRTSHNVAAPELLEQCDRMGMLVFDEAFDKYDMKIDLPEKADFKEYAERNLKNFVLRDRNHPSVFIWSVGNEIWDVQNDINNGFDRLKTMVNVVRKNDPSRPVTLVCDDQQSASLRHFDFYDVHSWNYGRRYSLARKLEPGKPVIISESASTVSTRGFYELPLPEKKTDFTKSLQVSSYDLNTPWWAEIPDDDFMWQQDEPYIAGEFVWTGFDYLGEPTPYDNGSVKKLGMSDREASLSSYFGIVDLCGIPKDRYYLYKSFWKPEETTVHILPHWNWKNKTGQKVPVFVYTNGDSAELFLNGKSLGFRHKDPASKKSVERFRLMWNDVTYQQGELLAVAYKNGKVAGRKTVKTASEPAVIKLTADRKVIKSGGMDLSYILIEAYDKNGNFSPVADAKVKITVKGPAKIAGIGNGNPQSFEGFQSDTVNLFYGKAMVILKSQFSKGNAGVTASSEGLRPVSVKIKIQ